MSDEPRVPPPPGGGDDSIPPGAGDPAPSGGRPGDSDGDVWRGIGLTFLLHLGAIVVAAGLAVTGDYGLIVALVVALGIGVSQVLWIVPAGLYAQRRSRPQIAKGLIIGAAITFLLNSACWALVSPFGPFDLFR